MVAAVRVHKTGGPEVMVYEQIELPAPGPGQIKIKQHAIGVNYIDTYFRMGMYPAPGGMPFVVGSEGAGEVVAVGSGVTELKVGDRVAAVVAMGGYAEERIIPADRAVKLPDNISYEQAAGMMLKGMTAQYLVRRTYKVEKGNTILVHAAAGGVGVILCQWGKALGATVIGTVGSDEKAALAKKAGCKHVVVTARENFVERVKAITKGRGVPVVYDGVGKDTFMGSLDCLSPLGLMVSFGNASGAVPPFNAGILAQKGSLFLTRPTLATYTASRADLVKAAQELFAVVKSRKVRISVNQTYPLREAAQAQSDLESRKTTGSTVLIP
jgi:NADPH2:quinone reductase